MKVSASSPSASISGCSAEIYRMRTGAQLPPSSNRSQSVRVQRAAKKHSGKQGAIAALAAQCSQENLDGETKIRRPPSRRQNLSRVIDRQKRKVLLDRSRREPPVYVRQVNFRFGSGIEGGEEFGGVFVATAPPARRQQSNHTRCGHLRGILLRRGLLRMAPILQQHLRDSAH